MRFDSEPGCSTPQSAWGPRQTGTHDRRWVLPAWVMPPRWVRSPDECSQGTSPQNPMNIAAVGKRRQSHTSDANVNTPSSLMPR